MTRFPLLSRAVATATAALGACALACALQGAFASPASAFTPATPSGAGGGENTPLNLNTSTSASHSTTSAGGASITRTIVGLAIVIAVIWGLAWVLRQVKAGRDPHVSSSGLTNIAALTLSNGRSVHLVRAGSEYVLLGSAEHGVVPIARYSEEEAREAGLVPGTRDRRVEEHSPVVGARPDPMRMAAPSSGVIERLRELTVRR
jgi:flagellar protein FliO/FliZ